MRLETVSTPDASDRRVRYAHLAGHGAPRPVRGVNRAALRRLLDHLGDHRCWNRRSSSWSWRILEQAWHAKLEKALAPSIHDAWRNLHLLRYFEVLKPSGSQQHNTTAHEDPRSNRHECAQLVFLALAIILAQFAVLAMEDGTSDAVAALAAVELSQRGSALGFVVDIGQSMQRFIDTAVY
jgi:hypothetical protein